MSYFLSPIMATLGFLRSPNRQLTGNSQEQNRPETLDRPSPSGVRCLSERVNHHLVQRTIRSPKQQKLDDIYQTTYTETLRNPNEQDYPLPRTTGHH